MFGFVCCLIFPDVGEAIRADRARSRNVLTWCSGAQRAIERGGRHDASFCFLEWMRFFCRSCVWRFGFVKGMFEDKVLLKTWNAISGTARLSLCIQTSHCCNQASHLDQSESHHPVGSPPREARMTSKANVSTWESNPLPCLIFKPPKTGPKKTPKDSSLKNRKAKAITETQKKVHRKVTLGCALSLTFYPCVSSFDSTDHRCKCWPILLQEGMAYLAMYVS